MKSRLSGIDADTLYENFLQPKIKVRFFFKYPTQGQKLPKNNLISENSFIG